MNKNEIIERNYRKIMHVLSSDIESGNKIALVCKLMLVTGMRLGNPKSSDEGYIVQRGPETGKKVNTYGAANLLKKHARVKNGYLHISFLGKKAVNHDLKIEDESFATELKKSRSSSSGDKLFGVVTMYSVRQYVKKMFGAEFDPKDLRSFRAIQIAKAELAKYKGRRVSKKQAREEYGEMCEAVAQILGNSTGVVRRSYLNEELFEDFYNRRVLK